MLRMFVLFWTVLQQHNREYQHKKSKIVCTQLMYLGSLMDEHQVRSNPTKIECLENWHSPHDVKTLRQFLGFAGYYWWNNAAFSRKIFWLIVIMDLVGPFRMCIFSSLESQTNSCLNVIGKGLLQKMSNNKISKSPFLNLTSFDSLYFMWLSIIKIVLKQI